MWIKLFKKNSGLFLPNAGIPGRHHHTQHGLALKSLQNYTELHLPFSFKPGAQNVHHIASHSFTELTREMVCSKSVLESSLPSPFRF
jgi:hypothetical protein